MRALIGHTSPTKKTNFLGEKNSVEVKKLTGTEVKEFQVYVNTEVKSLSESEQGLAIQRKIIRMGVVGAEDLTDEEIDGFPLDEISKLAKEVLNYSGIGSDDDKKGNV
jgi:hypothetical protein